MSTKHTPGPWIMSNDEVRTKDKSYDPLHVIGKTIGRIFGRDSEDKANAQLITQAPALLDALIELVKVAEKQLDQSATHEGMINADALAKARKAIADATR